MKISELIEKAGLKLVTKENYEDKEIKNCYIGDLLSWVMGSAEQDCAWVTIMSNVNIVAVASLVDAACIIIAEEEGDEISEDAIERANEKGIVILSTEKTSYQVAVDYYNLSK